MKILYLLQGLRNPYLDAFFSLVTNLGSETVFLAISAICYWCVSKKQGRRLFFCGITGTALNQMLKIGFRIPRPWMQNPDLTIVEAAKDTAADYSFPSGHTQTAVDMFGSIAKSAKKTFVKILCWGLVALTAFSRLYLGVHTPSDVFGALFLNIGLVLLADLVLDKLGKYKPVYYILFGSMTAICTVYLFYVLNHKWSADVDANMLADAINNAYVLFGCSVAILLGYFLDCRYIHFKTKAGNFGQILKAGIGLALVVFIKDWLKGVISGITVLSSGAADGLRYFLVVLFATAVWPFIFDRVRLLVKRPSKKEVRVKQLHPTISLDSNILL